MAPRRKVFVSYHHGGDRGYYDLFARYFADVYQVVQDNSVDREIGSEDADYVIRRIREKYLMGASSTIVLCGANTWGRKYVDWEVLASLNQNMAVIGINLPSNPRNIDGTYTVPGRLHDNIRSGYALFLGWNDVVAYPPSLSGAIEQALLKDKRLIDNSRDKRLQNAPLR